MLFLLLITQTGRGCCYRTSSRTLAAPLQGVICIKSFLRNWSQVQAVVQALPFVVVFRLSQITWELKKSRRAVFALAQRRRPLEPLCKFSTVRFFFFFPDRRRNVPTSLLLRERRTTHAAVEGDKRARGEAAWLIPSAPPIPSSSCPTASLTFSPFSLEFTRNQVQQWHKVSVEVLDVPSWPLW